jgi:hypothetical protein
MRCLPLPRILFASARTKGCFDNEKLDLSAAVGRRTQAAGLDQTKSTIFK